MRRLAQFVPKGIRLGVKRSLHRARFHRERKRQPGDRPRVVLLPSQEAWAASSNLRAYALVPFLRELGWRCTVLSPLLALEDRLTLLAAEEPDLLFMQQSRHALNRPRLYPYPTIFDADDADYLDPTCQAAVIECVEGAVAITVGSTYLASLLEPHNRRVHVVWTTTPPPIGPTPGRNEHRAPIVAWAHASPLGFPDESALMKSVLDELSRRRKFEFWLFGTQPGAAADSFLAPLESRGIKCRLLSWMSYDRYLSELGRVAIGLQPVCVVSDHSRGRSFGKILAYLRQRVAVVASNAVDHPLFFDNGKTGLLVGSVAEWVDAITDLLDHPAERAAMTDAAFEQFRRRLCSDTAASMYVEVFRSALAGSGGARLG